MITKDNFKLIEAMGGRYKLGQRLNAYNFKFDNIENSITFKFMGNKKINCIKVIDNKYNNSYKVKFYWTNTKRKKSKKYIRFTSKTMDSILVKTLNSVNGDILRKTIEMEVLKNV